MHMMNIQKTVKWFGVLLLVLGIIGFIPGIVSTSGLVFGIFLVSVLMNLIHIIAGLVGIESAMTDTAAQRYFRIVGVIFAVIAIFGFVSNGTIMTTNTASSVLAMLFALFALYQGFAPRATVITAPVL
jgi:hypothetical protein